MQANLTEAFAAAAGVAVPVTTIYVGNLPAGVNEHMLQLAFSVFGTISACEVRSCWLHMRRCCRCIRKHMNASARAALAKNMAHASSEL